MRRQSWASSAHQSDERLREAEGPEILRTELSGRLRTRSREIERSVLARIRHVGDAVDDADRVSTLGLRRAVAAAVSYCIEGIERGADWPMLIPPAAVRHARGAAREGVTLDLLLRCCMAGHRALEEFVVAEAEGIPGQLLSQILREQAPRVDRLLAAIADEYKDEDALRNRSPSQTKSDKIVRLVEGDGPAGPSDLDYDFDAWHIALIMRGPRAELAAGICAERLGYRLLYAIQDERTVWAWLSGPRRPDAAKVEGCLVKSMPPGLSASVGEPRAGLEGWRLSHREAHMGLQVMLQSGERFVRAREVALRFAVMRDDTIFRSLIDGYLRPVKTYRSGQSLLEALRAYLASGGNAAAAAAALGVKRHTVHRRIRRVEELLGRSVHSCLAELHIALQIDELDIVHESRGAVSGRGT